MTARGCPAGSQRRSGSSVPSAVTKRSSCRLDSGSRGVAGGCIAASRMPPGGAAVAADKGPPACAKIFFRPLPPGQNDGEQEAGIYTSRFSHLELKGSIKSGEPQDYYLTARNKKLNPLSGSVPAAVVNCAKE